MEISFLERRWEDDAQQNCGIADAGGGITKSVAERLRARAVTGYDTKRAKTLFCDAFPTRLLTLASGTRILAYVGPVSCAAYPPASLSAYRPVHVWESLSRDKKERQPLCL